MTQELQEYIKKGWRLDNETKEFYVVSKKTPFSIGKFVTFTVFTFGFGGLIYVLYHFSKQPKLQLLYK